MLSDKVDKSVFKIWNFLRGIVDYTRAQGGVRIDVHHVDAVSVYNVHIHDVHIHDVRIHDVRIHDARIHDARIHDAHIHDVPIHIVHIDGKSPKTKYYFTRIFASIIS